MPLTTTNLVSARTWHAKTPARRLAELQFSTDRYTSHLAKESWKTARQLMYNDMSNTLDAEEMVSGYGPASYAGELGLMSHLNNRLAMLSSLTPYAAQLSSFPMPLVDPVPPIMAMPLPAIPPAVPLPVPTPVPVATPVPVPAAPANIVNGMPVTVGPIVFGFQTVAVLGSVEAVMPLAGVVDMSLQRLAAVEALTLNAMSCGANGIVDLRLDQDMQGTVLAVGMAVSLLPVV